MDEDIQQEQVEQKELSPIEEQAMRMGWRPKEEFSGNEDDFIDAKEFVRRKPLFDKIEHQGKQIKAVTRALDEFKQHYTKVEQVAVEKAIQQLKHARKEALSEGDGDRFELIDDQIKNAEHQLRQIEVTKNTPVVDNSEPHPDFVAFKNRNGWYTQDAELTQFADKLGLGLSSTGMEPTEVLQEIEKQVRTRYPDKFRNKNKEAAPDTENSRNQGKPSKKEDDSFMSETDKKVMNDLVRQGVLTREEYIRDLKKIKGIK